MASLFRCDIGACKKISDIERWYEMRGDKFKGIYKYDGKVSN